MLILAPAKTAIVTSCLGAMAEAAFLLPGLVNGNGRIYLELGEIRKRLEVVEGKVDRVLRGTGPGEAGRGGDARVAALARAG